MTKTTDKIADDDKAPLSKAAKTEPRDNSPATNQPAPAPEPIEPKTNAVSTEEHIKLVKRVAHLEAELAFLRKKFGWPIKED